MPKDQFRVKVTEVKPSATDYDVVIVEPSLPHHAGGINVLAGSVKVDDVLEAQLTRELSSGRGSSKSWVYGIKYLKRPDGKDVFARGK